MSQDQPADPAYAVPTHESILTRLRHMDPETFERFVADVWAARGWRTRPVTSAEGEGIDVVAEDDETRHLIRTESGVDVTVESPTIHLSESRRDAMDADRLIVVTTGSFSASARTAARDLEVSLVDADDLLAMLDAADAWGLVADHVEDVERGADIDNAGTSHDGGVLDRLRSLLGL